MNSIAPNGWLDGEMRDVTFTVRSKQMHTSSKGTTYALLLTDIGTVKAWKNTYGMIEEGMAVRAVVECTVWNSLESMAVIRVHEVWVP